MAISTARSTSLAVAHPRAKFWQRLPGQITEIIFAIAILVFTMLPIFWLAITSLKPENRVYTLDVFFTPTIQNYFTIFDAPYNEGKLLLNSILVSLITVTIAIPLGVMAAYVFSRFHFRGSQIMMVGVLITQFIPPLVIAIPFYTLFRTLGMIDKLQALVVVYLSIVLPYSIWMLKGFIDALPIEIEEAASVDGCTEAQTLRYITLPLVMPGVITSLVFAFISCWNEFTYATILTRLDSATLPMGLMNISGVRGFYWELMAANGMIIMVPMFILSFAVRRYFIEGLTMGAVK
jgi:multiple sugar transport system permease protein